MALALVLSGACFTPPADVPVYPACEEDEPCWDCTTMGNGICGLTPTENEAELLESTTHNGTTEAK